ncbi:MAG: hypothetical protein WDO73_00545 [Ignavibacteriota bacterium]
MLTATRTPHEKSMKLVAKFTLVYVIVFGIGFALATYLAHAFLQRNATDEVIQTRN